MRLVYQTEEEKKTLKISLRFFTSSFSLSDETILNIDKEGRVISFIDANQSEEKTTYKRAFNGDWLKIQRPNLTEPRIRQWMQPQDIFHLFSRIIFFNSTLEQIIMNSKPKASFEDQDPFSSVEFSLQEIRELCLKILKKCTYKAYLRDKEVYNTVYTHIGILPPDRYGSLVLQVTQGCVYNQCSFCKLYKDIRYKNKTPTEFQQHCLDVKAFMGESLGRFHSIFLGDANALTIPYEDLLAIFKIISQEFIFSNQRKGPLIKTKPEFTGIFSFLDVFTGKKLSLSQLQELYRYQLRMVYFGIESGSYKILKMINKPIVDQDQIVNLIERCHACGIAVSVIFIIGLGGKEYQQEHIDQSISLIGKMNLEKTDLIYLSKLVTKANENIHQKHNVTLLSSSELELQYVSFKKSVKLLFKDKKCPQIAQYDIREFIY